MEAAGAEAVPLAAGTLEPPAGGATEETGVGMEAAGMDGLTAVLLVKGLDGEVMLSNLPAGEETAGADSAGAEAAGVDPAGGAVAVAGGAWI